MGYMMSDITITFNDGKQKTFPKNTTYYEISKSFRMPNAVVGVKVNNRITSLHEKAGKDESVSFFDLTDPMGNRIYTSGLKMIFEYAVKKTFPNIKVEYSYSLPMGMIVELDSINYLSNDDISVIREKMAKIVSDNMIIEKLIIKSSDGICYYNDINNNVKAENIRNIIDHTIALYQLDDLINYYYSEMPYSTEVLNKYEIKYLGKNRIVITYPTENGDGKTPDYVNYKGIIDSYIEGKDWLKTMKTPYINDINREITSGKIHDFVRSCELNFNLEINETASYIARNENIKCVMISGPSSSGKTTVTKRLANYFKIYGLDPIVISIDDYFHERVDTPKDENGEKDYECLQATDIKYLTSDVIKLFNGEEIMLPKFNFITGCKEVSGKKIKIKDNSIILFEGLHAINDELLPMIPSTIKYKIYVSPFIPLCLDEHNYISCNDLRLIRRIVRDFRTRGYGVATTIKYWQKVRNGENQYIVPFIHQANKIINTSLSYEVGVLKVFIEPLLYSVPITSEYYSEARRLLSFLKQFFTISSEFVPIDSIIREFIGGNND